MLGSNLRNMPWQNSSNRDCTLQSKHNEGKSSPARHFCCLYQFSSGYGLVGGLVWSNMLGALQNKTPSVFVLVMIYKLPTCWHKPRAPNDKQTESSCLWIGPLPSLFMGHYYLNTCARIWIMKMTGHKCSETDLGPHVYLELFNASRFHMHL